MPDERAALFDAIKAGDVPAVQALLEARPELAAARDDDGVSAVRLALYHRQAGTRDAVLAAGPPLDVFDAAALGRLDLLRDHLAADPAAVGARASDGFTSLHFAAFFGGADAVRLLLAAGADANADDENAIGVRPLHSAAAAGDAGALRALLEAGADPDARERVGGHTALQAAAHSDQPELARLLLGHGADPSLANDAGDDAAAMAGPRVRELLAR
jgi:ankyrin repeat protein